MTIALTFHWLASAAASYSQFIPFISSSPPIFISNLTRLSSISSNVRATGEITTTSVIPVYNVTVLISMFDDSNQIVGTQSGTTAFAATFLGRKNPFDIYTSVPNSQVAYITAQVTGWELASDQDFADISIVDVEIFVFPDTTRVVTTVQNNNPQPVYEVVGLAWSLQQENCLCPFPVSNFLSPGATGVFTSTLFGVGFPPILPEVGAAAQGVTEP